jgi:hypothetical protein
MKSLALPLLVFSLAAQAVPENDQFETPTVLDGLSHRVRGDNRGATKQPGEPDHAGNPGGASVWWSWTAPISGDVFISTAESDFDTLLAVYTGGSLGSLQLVAENDNEDRLTITSAVRFEAQAGQNYRIAVDGYLDDEPAAGLIRLVVTMEVPPKILSVVRLPDQRVSVTFTGMPGKVHQVLASQDLIVWTLLATFLNNTGTVEYIDPATSLSHRFYQIEEQD